MGYGTVSCGRQVARYLLLLHRSCIGPCEVWGFQDGRFPHIRLHVVVTHKSAVMNLHLSDTIKYYKCLDRASWLQPPRFWRVSLLKNRSQKITALKMVELSQLFWISQNQELCDLRRSLHIWFSWRDRNRTQNFYGRTTWKGTIFKFQKNIRK